MDNRQALGYMLLACKKAKLDISQIRELFLNMHYLFDMKTEKEAEEQGHNWYYNFEIEQSKKTNYLKGEKV